MPAKPKFRVTLENVGGVLDEATARNEVDARRVAIDLILHVPHLADGDVIRVTEINKQD